MSEITKRTSGSVNHGGIAQLYYARQEDVYDTLEIEEALLREQNTLDVSQAYIDSDFFKINYLQRTANHDEVPQPTSHGEDYKHVIEARIRANRTTTRSQTAYVSKHQLVMIFEDMNGKWWLLYGLTQLPTHNSGKEPRDANAHTMQWTTTLPVQAFRVSIGA